MNSGENMVTVRDCVEEVEVDWINADYSRSMEKGLERLCQVVHRAVGRGHIVEQVLGGVTYIRKLRVVERRHLVIFEGYWLIWLARWLGRVCPQS